MARKYEVTGSVKLINRLVGWLAKRGWTKREQLLTTTGAKSGADQVTPVTPISVGEHRYLVAPYGPVGWVHNVRAHPAVTLEHGRTVTSHRAVEVDPSEAAPVLLRYLQEVKIVRPFFDVSADSSLDEVAAVAPRHPVFRLGE